MKSLLRHLFVSGSLLLLTLAPRVSAAPVSLKVLTQSAYLPANPVLVRVEALTAAGDRDRDLWDAEATLTGSGGVTLSTNKVTLRNGMGSALIQFSGGGDFTLTATLGGLSTNRSLKTLVGVAVTSVSGTLAGSSTTWSNVINVTADVTVPVGHTLTVQSNTLVLMNGVASGAAGTRLLVNGTINSLGTELHPVTITCASAAQRWGQIRHDNAQPSLYRHTMITRGGFSTGEGHTGQTPVIRPNNSTVIFEDCSITDHADASGTPGKVGYGINSDLTFRNCLLARSRTGPEIEGTALLCTNTWFIDMRGPDDSDGIYLHGQQAGQQIRITGCVFAGGDDDGIDTLGSIVNVDNTILRDWNSVIEDAKAISVFDGATHIRRCLITDSTVGVSAKTAAGSSVLVTINNSTITGNLTNVLAQFKANAPGPVVDYRITNSVLWGGDAVQSDFAPTNFTIVYSDISEPWSGAGNISSDPLFVDAALRNFHLLTGSPCINTGDPLSPNDPDSSRADMGVYSFDAASGNGLFVNITAPLTGALFTGPANITIDASANSTTGTVAKVEFYQGTTKLGEDASGPYGAAWNGVAPGFYSLTAVAIDSTGFSKTSAPVNITVNASGAPMTNTLIALGSQWRYLDNGSDQGTTWSQPAFDASSWSNGVAPLGYCGPSCSYTIATTVNFGPDSANKYVTTYFRRNFTVANPAQVTALNLSLLKDDGAAVYINGVEVYRTTMPGGPITSTTFASVASNYTFEQAALPPAALAALVAGANVLAVEIHQGSGGSSDIVLEAQLDAVVAASGNLAPIVSLTAPPNNTTIAAPGSVTLTALASDSDGAVTNVAFYSGASKLGDDPSSPYSFNWNGAAAGNYALTAVATDNTGLSATSSVINLTVSTNTAPPVIFAKSPAPGSLTNLTQMSVTFSKPVLGVNASDLLVAGVPANAVSGSGSNYTFTFPQPAYGSVAITWASAHGIVDLFTPSHAFSTNSADANWTYSLLDSAPPVIAVLNPVSSATVASLANVSVTFSEPVTGVNAADLRVNATPAATLGGSGAGPYVFGFPQPPSGVITLAWVTGHGIADLSGNPFAGGTWSYTLDTNATGIVINEIMYHPSNESTNEEWIELFNRGSAPVNLAGWRFSAGVQFTFPAVAIPAGGYLVVCADTNAFALRYPGVSNIVGNWAGFLNNSGEDIDLDDANGNRVSSVGYADEGDWAVRQRGPDDVGQRGWVWFKPHDGLGKTLELINPAVLNSSGQNWASSITTNGTPGRVNSALNSNIAPLILEVTHFPVVPRSTDSPVITARILDEAAGSVTVTLQHRVSAASPPAFTVASMHDDGVNGDVAAGDGIYSATIAPQANNAVVEFYVRAVDLQGNVRTWPGPAIAAADGTGPTGQVANALFQIDDTPYNPTNNQPIYKLIMTAGENTQLAGIPCSGSQNSDAQMNGTFISLDIGGSEVRYLTGFRNRGHGSRCPSSPGGVPNYRVGFRSDEPWKGISSLNLNSQNSFIQHLGGVLARKSGVVGSSTVAVQLRVNNQNRAVSSSPMFGSYAAVEDLSGEWAAHHFPSDGNGNVYRAIRDIAPPDFAYRGETPSSYQNTYFKETNLTEDDWTDIIGMLRVVGINNATPFTTENVRAVVNVEQWMKHLAVMNILGNAESGLNTGYNDDYYMYRGLVDPRFVLTYHDLDSVLGVQSLGSGAGIFTATANNGSGQAMDRFLNWPDFQPLYFQTLQDLVNTTFAQANFDALVDQTLGDYVDAGTVSGIKSWMSQRRASVLSQIPAFTVSNAPTAIVTGQPRSPTPLGTATLTVGGSNVVNYKFKLDGGGYGVETPAATPINISGLANGTHTVAVIGKNALGLWQDVTNATSLSWVVNTAWPAVRLNEVLARNDTAVNHNGTFPDLIELFNEGGATVNLSGLRLTDDPASPNKFTFPPGSTLAAGAYLVVYANNPDATPGFHTGFTLDAEGEDVYLFDSAANGGALLDSVKFGLQLPDLAIGRVGASGGWLLTTPTSGAANIARVLGNQRTLKLNEWLASGLNPYPDDFIELYNPDPNPVALGGLALTDNPIGAPALSPITALSFIGGGGHTVFIADGGNGNTHASFKLAIEQGEIGLMAADRTPIDSVIYGPQRTDVASGRCPDGSPNMRSMVTATPGLPNACPFTPPAPQTLVLLDYTNVWKYDETGADLGVTWKETNYNDTAWLSGPALFGFDTVTFAEPVRTPFTISNTKTTFYFRVHFAVPPGTTVSGLQVTEYVDDGAVYYLNGAELRRINMAAGAVTATTFANVSVNDAASAGPFAVPTASLHTGDNVLAVEVHQISQTSGDVIFGCKLEAVIATNSPAAAGVVINEVLANNATLEEPDGSKPDWVEIYNPSGNAVDLAGMALTDDLAQPQRWVFSTGSLLPALGFIKVRLDPDLPASATNAGFGLKANGGAVHLINRPADGGSVASSVAYGLQAADFSIGRVPDGSTNWVLTTPSFGGANLAAALGDPLQLKVNEWMAAPASGEDWFEIYNPNPQPVNLSRFYLSDDVVDRSKAQLPALSFIGTGPYGFQKFDADNAASPPDHVPFRLNNGGEAIVISGTNAVAINAVTFGPQNQGVAQGRLPDGTGNIVSFPATPTPGKPNFLPLTELVINEVLTHTDPPLEDAVEIYNITGDDVNISGWYLSDSQNNLLKYRIPSNTVVRAGSHVVFYEYQFNSGNPTVPFSFSSAKGDEVYLSQSTAPLTLTGYRAFADFGAAENGVSFGRFLTSAGVDFTAMSARTFGQDNPTTTNQFRSGTGLSNAYPKVGPVVINEIMYNYPGDTNGLLEFVELHNILGVPVPLYDTNNPANTWRVRKGIDFDFPTGVVMQAGSYLVLVNFDPLIDTTALAAFTSAYGGGMTLLGPYGGKLDNGGEAIELQRPDAPQIIPGPDFGLVPHVVVDRVVYSDSAPWPTTPDGTGHSLKKITASLYGNEPLNWTGGSPTPGAANFSGGPPNTPPVLGAIGNKVVVEGNLLSFTASATDTDAPPQTLTFSLDPGAPGGASITPGGAFTWVSTEAQGPGSYPITIRVTDSGAPPMSDFETITITVGETNSAPALDPIGSKIVNEGQVVTFTAHGVDADLPANTLTYSLDPGAPPAAGINAANGAFSWVTTEADGPGVYSVTVRVTDNGTPVRSAFETIAITVNEANNAPALAAIGNRSVTESNLLTFTATATDSDTPAQTLTFSLDPGAPVGASITPGGAFAWTPHETNGPGVYTVTVRVTDNGSPVMSASETITITVNEANLPPVLAAIGNKSVNEGSLLSFTATATDPDLPAQTLTFSLDAGAPSGASITSGGVFTWTPGEAQGPSNYVVTVRVTDNGPGAASDFETITITVNEVNSAPILTAIGNKSVIEGNLLTFTATATDSDQPAQTLTYTLDAGVPSGASITTNGLFTWTPTLAQGPSNYVVTIRVTDNGSPPLDDFEAININVTETALQATLVSFTNTWRYNASGSNLFTAWKETAYDDSAWPSAHAVFFNETTPTTIIPAPTNTFLSLTGTAGQFVTNFYFRTKFFLPADATGVTLTASNVLDDGSVIYLNGVEAQRINMPAGPVLATTFSSASWEANVFFVTNISAAGLVPGENVLAVEVHQQSATSSDMVFGLSLTALVPPLTPIAITSQPTNLTVTTGASAQFSVGVSGSSPFYQWFKNGSPINGANTGSYTIASAQGADAGAYSVMVSNLASSATSGNAVLTVNPPANSPPVLSAIGSKTVNESNLLTFTATATDPQSPPQTLTFTLDAGAPLGASITTGGVFAWTPHETNGPGVFTVTVRVTDSGSPALDDFETITITVNEVNLPPVLAAIGNKTVTAGSNLTFIAAATDPDRPAQNLAFTLDAGAPAGASINASSGIFAWTPPVGYTPTTNQVTVRVTDNGSPALNDFKTFNIIVAGPPRVTSITVSPAGAVNLQWTSFAGKTYRVEYKPDFSAASWLPLGSDVLAAGSISSATDSVGANTRRFYRVRLMD